MTFPTVDLLAAIVRDDRRAFALLAACDPQALGRLADEQGVLPLVAQRLAADPGMPAGLRQYAADESRRHLALDMVWEAALRIVIDALHHAGVSPILMKGEALARTHYERPDLRARVDTDVLISPANRARAERALADLNYEPVRQSGGSVLMYQQTFRRRQGTSASHVLDLHWRIANPHRFADVLSYEDAASRAVPVPSLSSWARALAPVDALLIACVHRVAHHFNDDRLIWLYDIHLLASRLTAAEWTAFADRARRRGVWTIARGSLCRASAHFETQLPALLRQEPAADAASRENATAAFLNHDRRQVTTFLDDLRALSRWSDRGRLVRQHLFPPRAYMREVYAPASSAPLGVLYVRRVLRGARKWLVRP